LGKLTDHILNMIFIA